MRAFIVLLLATAVGGFAGLVVAGVLSGWAALAGAWLVCRMAARNAVAGASPMRRRN